jgi:hypothetical protein
MALECKREKTRELHVSAMKGKAHSETALEQGKIVRGICVMSFFSELLVRATSAEEPGASSTESISSSSSCIEILRISG